MSNSFENMAVGIYEMDSLVACYVALDAASKAADITVQSVERNRLKSGACVKIRGSVSDVRAAMEAGLAAGAAYGTVVHQSVIASPDKGTELALAMTIHK
ncbi:MAG: BMC domain-containing protein [Candidatus Choladocola sp.]|nr:BMC domain-containing protein [Candidatus Choladocola sp.]